MLLLVANCAWSQACSHFLRLLFLLIVVVIVIIVLFILLVVGCLLRVVLLLLLGRFDLVQGLPLFGKGVSLSCIVSDDYVVKNRSALHLPQIETEEAKVIVLVHFVVILILWVCDFLGLPISLVRGVGNSLAIPVSFVCWIVFHWGLPLSILLVVPIVGFLGIAVDNTLLLDPIVWLLVLWIVNHGFIGPIVRLLVIWIRDLLWFQHLPIILDGSLVDFLFVDFYPNCVVRLQDQSVQMRCAVVFLLI